MEIVYRVARPQEPLLDGLCFSVDSSLPLTYHPGSRNIKPDTLSHQFAPPVEDTPVATLPPPSCVVSAVRWEINYVV